MLYSQPFTRKHVGFQSTFPTKFCFKFKNSIQILEIVLCIVFLNMKLSKYSRTVLELEGKIRAIFLMLRKISTTYLVEVQAAIAQFLSALHYISECQIYATGINKPIGKNFTGDDCIINQQETRFDQGLHISSCFFPPFIITRQMCANQHVDDQYLRVSMGLTISRKTAQKISLWA